MFKIDKNILIILIMSILFAFGLTIGNPFALGNEAVDIVIYEDGTYSQDNGEDGDQVYLKSKSNFELRYTYLTFDDGTKLTYRYLLDNPDFSISFTSTSTSSITFSSTDSSFLDFKSGTLYNGGTCTLNADSKLKYSNFGIEQTLSEWFNDDSYKDTLSSYLDLPIVVFSNDESIPWTLKITGMITPIEKLMNNTIQVSNGLFGIANVTTDFFTSNGILLVPLIIAVVFFGIGILFKIKNSV